MNMRFLKKFSLSNNLHKQLKHVITVKLIYMYVVTIGYDQKCLNRSKTLIKRSKTLMKWSGTVNGQGR
jgi:hypothetical protein